VRRTVIREVPVTNEPTAASLWRIEFAKELIEFYVPRPGIEMAVLGGSPPKGLSDEYSDLDIIVFWDEVDVEWLEKDPLREVDCERKHFRRMGEEDVYLESQYFGALKADFGHIKMDLWERTVDDVLVRHSPDPSNLDSMSGFLTSEPLFGGGLVRQWKERISEYPDELAENVVRANRRFFVPGYLLNQAHGRGEALAFADGRCQMLKNLLSILAGLNRVYFSAEEPRWIEHYLGLMECKPDDAWERVRSVLSLDGEEAVAALESLMLDVLGLIGKHMPQVNGDYEGRWRSMEVTARPDKPEIVRRQP
jgi:hypothetical protein